mmetsp:Transcript_19038/g.39251  ORF Transcript_19038/g.39251 Transcript_19038/m.39251 type:complete len:286 (-) Transcript_19038:77-934(-)|eukprot:CAMPEP_0171651088 /NCGR_PEP_ID=MMETSP0990-20121206/38084_1 /TAXON_ID=483369 /ORGANISM="non described non described, Strain CCMP2098" /LENGTH=285 /DNA_ID=CAMNT_0012229917 /DNA_START=55 /DNA_END=912 /DNA_ORIENTATION=-
MDDASLIELLNGSHYSRDDSSIEFVEHSMVHETDSLSMKLESCQGEADEEHIRRHEHFRNELRQRDQLILSLRKQLRLSQRPAPTGVCHSPREASEHQQLILKDKRAQKLVSQLRREKKRAHDELSSLKIELLSAREATNRIKVGLSEEKRASANAKAELLQSHSDHFSLVQEAALGKSALRKMEMELREALDFASVLHAKFVALKRLSRVLEKENISLRCKVRNLKESLDEDLKTRNCVASAEKDPRQQEKEESASHINRRSSVDIAGLSAMYERVYGKKLDRG